MIAENATVYEFTPYEFGAWGWTYGGKLNKKVNGAFMSMEYLGTRLVDGKVAGQCWKGLDQLR